MSSTEQNATLTIRLDAELRAAFSAACKAQDQTVAQELRRFMRDYVQRVSCTENQSMKG